MVYAELDSDESEEEEEEEDDDESGRYGVPCKAFDFKLKEAVLDVGHRSIVLCVVCKFSRIQDVHHWIWPSRHVTVRWDIRISTSSNCCCVYFRFVSVFCACHYGAVLR